MPFEFSRPENQARSRALSARLRGLPAGLHCAHILLRGLLALLLGLPAGLSHAAAVKISAAAARAPLGGGFSFGAWAAALPGSGAPTLSGPVSLNMPAPAAPSALAPPNGTAASPGASPSLSADAVQAMPAAADLTLPAAAAPSVPTAARPVAGALPAAPIFGRAVAGEARRPRRVQGRGAREQTAAAGAFAARPSLRAALSRGAAWAEQTLFAGPEAARALAGRLFHGKRALPPAAAADYDAGPKLPNYLQTAEKENLAWLIDVYAAAQNSPTARKVLEQVEALTGNGHMPLVLEVVDYHDGDEAEFNWDWKIVRLGAHMMKYADPAQAVPSFIHELTHVLQEAEGLPLSAVELELEAYLHSFKVADELGLSFKRGHALLSYSRTFKRSYDAFIRSLVEDEYVDSVTIMNESFAAVETELLRQVAAHERTIAEWEQQLVERQEAYKLLERHAFDPLQLKNYKAQEIEGAKATILSWESSLNWLLDDLKRLRTPGGRKRYADFARSVLKRTRDFQRVYGSGVKQRRKPVRLPSAADAAAFAPSRAPEPAQPKARRKPAPQSDAAPPTRAVRVTRDVDAKWLSAVLQAMNASAVGREVIARAEAAHMEHGRPVFLDLYHTAADRMPAYDWDTGVIEVSHWVYTLPAEEAAALLVGAVAQAAGHRVAPSYALEFELEGWLLSMEAAHEFGLKLKRPNPLYFARRALKKKSLDGFIAWVRKQNTDMQPFSGLSAERFKSGLTRLEEKTHKRIERRRRYLRSRRATYELMRGARLPRFTLRTYRADEVVGTETRILEEQAALSWIERDRGILGDAAKLAAYRRYADAVMDRAARLHQALRPQRRD